METWVVLGIGHSVYGDSVGNMHKQCALSYRLITNQRVLYREIIVRIIRNA
jgi:hypothetical protein